MCPSQHIPVADTAPRAWRMHKATPRSLLRAMKREGCLQRHDSSTGRLSLSAVGVGGPLAASAPCLRSGSLSNGAPNRRQMCMLVAVWSFLHWSFCPSFPNSANISQLSPQPSTMISAALPLQPIVTKQWSSHLNSLWSIQPCNDKATAQVATPNPRQRTRWVFRWPSNGILNAALCAGAGSPPERACATGVT